MNRAKIASNFPLARRLGTNKQRRGKARAAAEADPALKAVLIYENLAAGVRARGFLQKLAYASNRTLEEQIWTSTRSSPIFGLIADRARARRRARFPQLRNLE